MPCTMYCIVHIILTGGEQVKRKYCSVVVTYSENMPWFSPEKKNKLEKKSLLVNVIFFFRVPQPVFIQAAFLT